MLGFVLALGGCVWGGVGAGVGHGPSPGSVGLPAWTRLNGTALRRSGPQSIEILVDEPAHFRAVADFSHRPHDAYQFELSLKDPSPRLGKTLAKTLAKRFALSIRGIRASDDTTASWGADLSLFVIARVHWAPTHS
jgi:hypothetical protein